MEIKLVPASDLDFYCFALTLARAARTFLSRSSSIDMLKNDVGHIFMVRCPLYSSVVKLCRSTAVVEQCTTVMQ